MKEVRSRGRGSEFLKKARMIVTKLSRGLAVRHTRLVLSDHAVHPLASPSHRFESLRTRQNRTASSCSRFASYSRLCSVKEDFELADHGSYSLTQRLVLEYQRRVLPSTHLLEMPRPPKLVDLPTKNRFIGAVQAGLSIEDAAQQAGLSNSTASSMWKEWQTLQPPHQVELPLTGEHSLENLVHNFMRTKEGRELTMDELGMKIALLKRAVDADKVQVQQLKANGMSEVQLHPHTQRIMQREFLYQELVQGLVKRGAIRNQQAGPSTNGGMPQGNM
jgi:hypothetical protein